MKTLDKANVNKSSKFIGKISRKHAFGHSQTQMNNYVMAYIHLAKEKKYYKGKK